MRSSFSWQPFYYLCEIVPFSWFRAPSAKNNAVIYRKSIKWIGTLSVHRFTMPPPLKYATVLSISRKRWFWCCWSGCDDLSQDYYGGTFNRGRSRYSGRRKKREILTVRKRWDLRRNRLPPFYYILAPPFLSRLCSKFGSITQFIFNQARKFQIRKQDGLRASIEKPPVGRFCIRFCTS